MRILHISDIQEGKFGVKYDLKKAFKRDWKDKYRLLLEDCKDKFTEIHKNKSVDIIIISGDLTSQGKKEEYTALTNELIKMMKVVFERVPNENWLIVPGNHDVQWGKNDKRFDEFVEFCHNNRFHLNYEKGKPYSIFDKREFTDKITGIKIEIILLNSCLEIKNKRTNKKCNINADYFNEIKKNLESNTYKIMVCHHRLNELSSGKNNCLKKLQERNVCLALAGDFHASLSNVDNINRIDSIPAGALFARESERDVISDKIPRQFNVYDLDFSNKKLRWTTYKKENEWRTEEYELELQFESNTVFLNFKTSIEKLCEYSKIARFRELGPLELKSPLELIKESPKEDEILPMMNQMFKINSIQEQKKFAVKQEYAKKYSFSWADFEVQLIGLYLLERKIFPHFKVFTDMYDAGCANLGQYRALMALNKLVNITIDPNFEYFGQDFNSDWKDRFDEVKKGHFIEKTLPDVDSKRFNKHTLVCCTHTLHYLGYNPLGMYSVLFSFNLLLKEKGICYITIPEKTALPGMPDIIIKAAIDSGFDILDKGKYRLLHEIRDGLVNIGGEPLNISAFSYIVLMKKEENKDIIYNQWLKFIGPSLFKAQCFDLAKTFEIENSTDISPEINTFEDILNGILTQRNLDLITFIYALDLIKIKYENKIPNETDCINNIQNIIPEFHEIYNADINLSARKSNLKLKSLDYFFWLISFFISRHKNNLNNMQELKLIYDNVKDVFNSNEDIRVNLKLVSDKEIARLLRNLFDICRYEKIDIRKAFDKKDFSYLLPNNN